MQAKQLGYNWTADIYTIYLHLNLSFVSKLSSSPLVFRFCCCLCHFIFLHSNYISASLFWCTIKKNNHPCALVIGYILGRNASLRFSVYITTWVNATQMTSASNLSECILNASWRLCNSIQFQFYFI